MSTRVGILGLGRIGGTAGRMLLDAGYDVMAVERPSAAWLKQAGGTLLPDAATLAQKTDVVIGTLSREEDVEEAVFGSRGLVSGAREGLTFADMGTFSVALKERIHDA
ncbi:MAG: NAD(P)-binding domain-containing protein, partial [Alphaproteobacteria bacterium]|nr:NAD(P)-binding domain-containing protein [Alphaproteobacteria bacterium]